MRFLAVAVCAGVLLGATAAVGQGGYVGATGCHKGFFWPFSRSKGDCLTDAEKKNGETGNYLDPNPSAAPTAAPAPNVVAAPAPNTVAAAPTLNTPAQTPAPVAQARTPNPGPAAPPANTGGGLFGTGRAARDPGLLSDNPAIANTGPVVVNTPAPPPAPVQAARPPAPPPVVANTAAANPAPAPIVANAAPANPAPVAANAPAPAPANRDALITRTEANGLQCTKGFFWPFSRDKGDCLTDAEKKNGLTGNYLDPNPGAPLPTRTAAAAVPPAAPTVATARPPAPPPVVANAPAANPAPVAANTPAPAPAVANPAPANPAPVAASAPAPAPANRDALITRTEANGVQCTKGFFWPFSRDKGDCLTDAEKKNGLTGNYLDPNPGAAPPAVQASVAALAPRAPLAPPPAAAPQPVARAAECTKGPNWPLVRGATDCLTDEEKSIGWTGTYGNATRGTTTVSNGQLVSAQVPPAPPRVAVAPPAAPSVAAPPTPPPAQVASIQTPAATPAPAAREGAVITRTETNGVKCTKGILWPFSRSKGDCLTDAEKKNGQTGNYLDPTPGALPVTPASSGPAAQARPVVNATPAAANTNALPAANDVSVTKTDDNAAKCDKGFFSKGFLWPFSRAANDCQAEADTTNSGSGAK